MPHTFEVQQRSVQEAAVVRGSMRPEEIGRAYERLMSWVAAEGLTPVGDPWESYLDGPEVPQPRTPVCVPCAAEETSPDADPSLRPGAADG